MHEVVSHMKEHEQNTCSFCQKEALGSSCWTGWCFEGVGCSVGIGVGRHLNSGKPWRGRKRRTHVGILKPLGEAARLAKLSVNDSWDTVHIIE